MAERVRIDVAVQNAWLLGQDVPGVRFRMCQPVEVVAGPGGGARGILITILALTPEPEYLLETEPDGDDVVVAQSRLRVVDDGHPGPPHPQ